jgi:hypothetical protein
LHQELSQEILGFHATKIAAPASGCQLAVGQRMG